MQQILDGLANGTINSDTQFLNGRTALHIAAAGGDARLVSKLLNDGLNANVLDNEHNLPIHCVLAIPFGEESDKSAAILNRTNIFRELAKKTKPEMMSQQTMMGENIVHLMAKFGFSDLLKEYIAKNSSLLLQKTTNEENALHLALLNKQYEQAMALAQLSELINAAGKRGKAPIHYACAYAGKDIIATLLTLNASVTVEDYDGKTAIMTAVDALNIEALEVFKANSLLTNPINTRGQSIYNYAQETQNETIAAWLTEHNITDNIPVRST